MSQGEKISEQDLVAAPRPVHISLFSFSVFPSKYELVSVTTVLLIWWLFFR